MRSNWAQIASRILSMYSNSPSHMFSSIYVYFRVKHLLIFPTDHKTLLPSVPSSLLIVHHYICQTRTHREKNSKLKTHYQRHFLPHTRVNSSIFPQLIDFIPVYYWFFTILLWYWCLLLPFHLYRDLISSSKVLR